MYEDFNKNHPGFYSGICKETVKEGVFERFPELIPAIGEHYWRAAEQHCKLLLIGESNYFDEKFISSSVFMDDEKWYKMETGKLIPAGMKKAVCSISHETEHSQP